MHLKWKISAIYGRKHCEKRRNCLLQAISPFLTMFPKAIYLMCVKMWHCVIMGLFISVRVNSLPNDKILDWSKLKAFADNKINVTEKLKFVLERV